MRTPPRVQEANEGVVQPHWKITALEDLEDARTLLVE